MHRQECIKIYYCDYARRLVSQLCTHHAAMTPLTFMPFAADSPAAALPRKSERDTIRDALRDDIIADYGECTDRH